MVRYIDLYRKISKKKDFFLKYFLTTISQNFFLSFFFFFFPLVGIGGRRETRYKLTLEGIGGSCRGSNVRSRGYPGSPRVGAISFISQNAVSLSHIFDPCPIYSRVIGIKIGTLKSWLLCFLFQLLLEFIFLEICFRGSGL